MSSTQRPLRLLAALAAFATAAAAQLDPLTLPTPRPASPGAYQWGVELLRLDRAWQLTRGRAHIALIDGGYVSEHEDLRSGLDGNLRRHLSQPIEDLQRPYLYHAMLVAGVVGARGGNGVGISGACPQCAISLHNWTAGSTQSIHDAIASGAAAINMSLGGHALSDVEPESCERGTATLAQCQALRKAEERDVVVVAIAGNTFANRVGFPANTPSVIGVAGLQPGPAFWSQGYVANQFGSSYAPFIRLAAPARDILTTHPANQFLYGPDFRCGDRVDSTVSGAATLPPSYAGYGDCWGTSFAAPLVTGIAALVRSVNPLLSQAEVRAILEETATRPVAGPAGSSLTFYIPDAEAAVQRALGPGRTNRMTPMFSLHASASGRHLFTTSPQTAVAAIAGELKRQGLAAAATYAGFGDAIPGYERFSGRICDVAGGCVQPQARGVFQVFTTEAAPAGTTLVPLHRLTQVCEPGPGCATDRAFAYATTVAGVQALEARGYVVDGIEGYVYSPDAPAPANALSLCLAFDAARIDHVLYAAAQCNRTVLANAAGENTGGAYGHVARLGFVPTAEAAPANQTALWWNPAEAGWGVNFAHQGDILFGTLFTYDAARNPLWLVMPDGRLSGGTYAGALYRTTGPAFDAVPFTPIGPQNLTRVGDMRVTFAAGGATLVYDVNGTQVTKTVTRQVFGAAPATCVGMQGSRATLSNYQDLWWNPDESGWGMNITHQGDILFATLFTYGRDGQGLWLVMSEGRRQPDGRFTGDLYRTRGSPFNASPILPLAPGDVTKVGTMTLRFSDGQTGTLQYSVDGAAVTKAITRQVFGTPAAACNG